MSSHLTPCSVFVTLTFLTPFTSYPRAWLQNISQAARNSTISTSSGSHRTAHSDPSSATSHVTVQASSHINQSPSSRPPTSFAHRFRRDREQQQTEVRGSSNPSKRAALLPPLPGTAVSKGDTSALIIGNPELVHPALNGYTLPNTTLGNGARRIGLPAEAFR